MDTGILTTNTLSDLKKMLTQREQRNSFVKKKRYQNPLHDPKPYIMEDGEVPLIGFFCLKFQSSWMKLGFSTRFGGVSQGQWSSLNLSFDRGDSKEHVIENYKRAARSMGCDFRSLILSDQVHQTKVQIVDETYCAGPNIEKKLVGVDGLVTNVPGILLATSYADCVPLFFVDPVHKVIASSHSGWKGTVNKIGKETINKMKDSFDTKAEDLIAIIGPSICQNCYQVSSDVAEQFQAAYSPEILPEILYENGSEEEIQAKNTTENTVENVVENVAENAVENVAENAVENDAENAVENVAENAVEDTAENTVENDAENAVEKQENESKNKKFQLDLWAANYYQFVEAGLQLEHIFVSQICTCCNSSMLFSHRASKGRRGNLNGFITITKS